MKQEQARGLIHSLILYKDNQHLPNGKYCKAKSKKSAMSSTIHSGSEAKTGVVSCGRGRCTSIPPIGDGVTYLLATILCIRKISIITDTCKMIEKNVLT